MSEYAVEPTPEIEDDLELLDAVRTWDYIGAIDKAPSIDAAAALCAAVQSARAALALAEGELARFVNDVLPYGSKLTYDGHVYEVKSGSERQAWEHAEVKVRVAATIADRLGIDGYEVSRVLSAWTDCCGFQWKVTGLRGLGLDPDDYCTKRPGVPRLVRL